MNDSANIDFANVATLEQDGEESSFSLLSRLHPLRMAHIVQQCQQNLDVSSDNTRPLQGIHALDVGCGRGFISASLARLGADVTAIDVSAKALSLARRHAQFHDLAIDYREQTIEALAAEKQEQGYDLVVHCEVIEHIPHPRSFMQACLSVMKPTGIQILSTPNRSWASYLVMIVCAENLFGWLAKGSHDWQRFITPTEMRALLRDCDSSARVIDERGVHFDIVRRAFRFSEDKQVNYFMTLAV